MIDTHILDMLPDSLLCQCICLGDGSRKLAQQGGTVQWGYICLEPLL